MPDRTTAHTDSATVHHGLHQDLHHGLESLFDALHVLLPPRLHPEALRAEERTARWFAGTELPVVGAKRERLRNSEVGYGTAAAFPGVSYEAVSLWARFALWQLTFDDVCAEETAAHDLPAFVRRAGRLWRMLHETLPPCAPDDPFASVLRPLLLELDELAPPITATRVRQALRDYLFAATWEAVDRADGAAPARSDYRAYYPHAGGLPLQLEFAEIAPGALLDETARRGTPVRAMRAAVYELTSLVNQLCSAPFENEHDSGFGPASPPGQDGGTCPERCLEQARTIADLRDAGGADPATNTFMSVAADWAAGTMWWHRRALSHRYATQTTDAADAAVPPR